MQPVSMRRCRLNAQRDAMPGYPCCCTKEEVGYEDCTKLRADTVLEGTNASIQFSGISWAQSVGLPGCEDDCWPSGPPPLSAVVPALGWTNASFPFSAYFTWGSNYDTNPLWSCIRGDPSPGTDRVGCFVTLYCPNQWSNPPTGLQLEAGLYWSGVNGAGSVAVSDRLDIESFSIGTTYNQSGGSGSPTGICWTVSSPKNVEFALVIA